VTGVYVHNVSGLPFCIEPDEGGWYVAYVPDLPGCVSQGRTLFEAALNISEAIEDVLSVIEQDDPERYEALTSVTVGGAAGVTDSTGAEPEHLQLAMG
jgi:predicted RNase H-like HicB family nuclease